MPSNSASKNDQLGFGDETKKAAKSTVRRTTTPPPPQKKPDAQHQRKKSSDSGSHQGNAVKASTTSYSTGAPPGRANSKPRGKRLRKTNIRLTRKLRGEELPRISPNSTTTSAVPPPPQFNQSVKEKVRVPSSAHDVRPFSQQTPPEIANPGGGERRRQQEVQSNQAPQVNEPKCSNSKTSKPELSGSNKQQPHTSRSSKAQPSKFNKRRRRRKQANLKQAKEKEQRTDNSNQTNKFSKNSPAENKTKVSQSVTKSKVKLSGKDRTGVGNGEVGAGIDDVPPAPPPIEAPANPVHQNENKKGRKNRSSSRMRQTSSTKSESTPTIPPLLTTRPKRKYGPSRPKHARKNPRSEKQSHQKRPQSMKQTSPKQKESTKEPNEVNHSSFKKDQKDLRFRLGKVESYPELIELLETILPIYRQKDKLSSKQSQTVREPNPPSGALPNSNLRNPGKANLKHTKASSGNCHDPATNRPTRPKNPAMQKGPITPPSSPSCSLSLAADRPSEILSEKADSKRETGDGPRSGRSTAESSPSKKLQKNPENNDVPSGQLAQMTPSPSILPASSVESTTPFTQDLAHKMQARQLMDSNWTLAKRQPQQSAIQPSYTNQQHHQFAQPTNLIPATAFQSNQQMVHSATTEYPPNQANNATGTIPQSFYWVQQPPNYVNQQSQYHPGQILQPPANPHHLTNQNVPGSGQHGFHNQAQQPPFNNQQNNFTYAPAKTLLAVIHVETPFGLVPLYLYQHDDISDVVRNFCARWGMTDCVSRLYQSIIAKILPY